MAKTDQKRLLALFVTLQRLRLARLLLWAARMSDRWPGLAMMTRDIRLRLALLVMRVARAIAAAIAPEIV